MQRFKSGVANDDDAATHQQHLRLATAAVLLDIAYADDTRARTIDHFALTNFIRKNMPLESRIDMVKEMWRIVYSDGRLTDYENYLVRKLADLLGLEHHVMIGAKVAVLEELGKAAK